MQGRILEFFKRKTAAWPRHHLALLAALFFLGWLLVELVLGR
ncbi:hypothetical protein [Meiothermus sp. QL-1]|nr:hypothetical protein [Meiothermus sp. QL-1]